MMKKGSIFGSPVMRVMKIPFALSLSKPVMSLSNGVNVNPLMVRQAHHERFNLANITRFLGLPHFYCLIDLIHTRRRS